MALRLPLRLPQSSFTVSGFSYKMVFSLVIHHGGRFRLESFWHYHGGQMEVIQGLDEHSWTFADTVVVVKDMGYTDTVTLLWWRTAEDAVAHQFRAYLSDDDAIEMARFATSSLSEAHIYVETFGETSEDEQPKEKQKAVKSTRRLRSTVKRSQNNGPIPVIVLCDDEDDEVLPIPRVLGDEPMEMDKKVSQPMQRRIKVKVKGKGQSS